MNELEAVRAKGEKKEVYYGWIVVAGVFFMVAVSCGAFYSFGVFFVPIMEEFKWARGVISGVLFVSGITYAVAVPLIGSIADRFGYKWISIITAGLMGLGFVLGSRVQTVWQMYLFIGLLPGIGACATHTFAEIGVIILAASHGADKIEHVSVAIRRMPEQPVAEKRANLAR